MLREWRGDRSLRSVASAVGIEPSTLQRIENLDVVDAKFGLVVRLAKHLGIPFDLLVAAVPPVEAAPATHTALRDDNIAQIVRGAEAITAAARRLARTSPEKPPQAR